MAGLRSLTICMLIVSLLFAGCATTDGKTSVAGSTILGALGGAVGGALTAVATGNTKNLVAYTVGGAVAGGVVGLSYALIKNWSSHSSIKSEPQKDYHATKKEIGYSPSKGDLVKISKSSLEPYAVEPISGNKVTWDATYYVMTPSDKKEVKVTETRILKVYDSKKKEFIEPEGGRVSEDIFAAQGTRNAPGILPLEGNEDEGKYLIGFMVSSEGKSDVKWMPLTITKDKKIIAQAQRNMHHKPSDDGMMVASASAPGGKAVDINKDVTVIAEKANLREQPNTTAKIISKASKGETYPMVCSKDVNGKDWCELTLDDGRTAWVLGSSVKVVEE